MWSVIRIAPISNVIHILFLSNRSNPPSEVILLPLQFVLERCCYFSELPSLFFNVGYLLLQLPYFLYLLFFRHLKMPHQRSAPRHCKHRICNRIIAIEGRREASTEFFPETNDFRIRSDAMISCVQTRLADSLAARLTHAQFREYSAAVPALESIDMAVKAIASPSCRRLFFHLFVAARQR